MARDFSCRTRDVPVEHMNTAINSRLKQLSEEEVEELRTRVQYLGERLYDMEVSERLGYGLLLLFFVVGWVWDVAKLSDMAYYIIKFILDVILIVTAVGTYDLASRRKTAQDNYWKAIFGDAYHD